MIMHFEPDLGINSIPGDAIYLWIKMNEILAWAWQGKGRGDGLKSEELTQRVISLRTEAITLLRESFLVRFNLIFKNFRAG